MVSPIKCLAPPSACPCDVIYRSLGLASSYCLAHSLVSLLLQLLRCFVLLKQGLFFSSSSWFLMKQGLVMELRLASNLVLCLPWALVLRLQA